MRVTRSTAAAAAVFEDEFVDTQMAGVPSPRRETATARDRAPLGELTASVQNEQAEAAFAGAETCSDVKRTPLFPGRRMAAGGDHGGDYDGRYTPRDRMHVDGDTSDDDVEVLEDDYQSETSSAAEEACRLLLRPAMDSVPRQPRISRPDKLSTPASKAVKRARKQLNSTPKTTTRSDSDIRVPTSTRFDPDVHVSPKVLRSPTRAECDDNSRRDSFVDDIINNKTPARARRLQLATMVEEDAASKGTGSNAQEVSETLMDNDTPSTVPATLPNSPPSADVFAKRRSRIEDSFDALDAMEDMLDEVKDSLACVDRPDTARTDSPEQVRPSQLDRLKGATTSRSAPQTPRGRAPVEMPTKASTHDRMPTRVINSPPSGPVASSRSSSKPHSSASRSTSNSNSNGGSSSSSDKTVNANSNGSTGRQQTMSVGSLKPMNKPAPRPATKPMEMPPRPKAAISSINRKPFVPAKSSKAPTTSAFTLPGEAVSARLKAQREARLANSSPGASSGGASPTTAAPAAGEKRKSLGSEVRMTAAALARLQIARGEKPTPVQRRRPVPVAHSTAPPPRAPAGRLAVPSSTTASRPPSSRPVPAAARAAHTKTPSSTAAPRPGFNQPANTAVKRPRPVSGVIGAKVDTGLTRMPSTKSVTGQPPAKKQATQSSMTTPAQRAEAAKRARAEAAERGRQASRAWAEKIRKRNSTGPADK